MDDLLASATGSRGKRGATIRYCEAFASKRGGTTGFKRTTAVRCRDSRFSQNFPPAAGLRVLDGFSGRVSLRHDQPKQTKRDCARHTAGEKGDRGPKYP